ncbi:MAG: flagellar protein [Clostridiales bacterium]|nr:flagellar protein [Clostridiales bacterium]
MDVINCKRCGNIFNYFVGEKICPTCKNKLNEQFDTVKDYIYNNPKASIQEVSRECDVSMAQITKWVREERLEFTEDSLVGIECERCGVSIRTGRYCKSCKTNLTSELSTLYKSKEKSKGSNVNKKSLRDHRMRFLE